MSNPTEAIDDLITVSTRRPSNYYAAAIYAKFRSNLKLYVQAKDTAIPLALEIAQEMARKGDATIIKLETFYDKTNTYSRVHGVKLILTRTSQLDKKIALRQQ